MPSLTSQSSWATDGLRRVVEQCSLFSDLGPEWQRRLLGVARHRTLHRDQVLMHEGVEADRLYVVLDGWMKQFRIGSDGREVLTGLLGGDDLVGADHVLDGPLARHSIRSLTTVMIVGFPGPVVRDVAQQSPLGAALGRWLSTALRRSENERLVLATSAPRIRVVKRLYDLASRTATDDGDIVVLALTQEDLSAWAAVSRETTAKVLHDLRIDGTVRTARRRITVLRLAELRRQASDELGRPLLRPDLA